MGQERIKLFKLFKVTSSLVKARVGWKVNFDDLLRAAQHRSTAKIPMLFRIQEGNSSKDQGFITNRRKLSSELDQVDPPKHGILGLLIEVPSRIPDIRNFLNSDPL